jgi:hypothetical protein
MARIGGVATNNSVLVSRQGVARLDAGPPPEQDRHSPATFGNVPIGIIKALYLLVRASLVCRLSLAAENLALRDGRQVHGVRQQAPAFPNLADLPGQPRQGHRRSRFLHRPCDDLSRPVLLVGQ